MGMNWKTLVGSALAVALLLPYSAAAGGIVPCTGLDCTVEKLLELLVNIYNALLGFAALVAMGFIIWGGVQMLLYSFSEQPTSQLESAKLTLRRAIFGFMLVIGAYLIVQTVLFVLGFKFGLGNLEQFLRGG